MAAIVIRPARVRDLKAILELWRQAGIRSSARAKARTEPKPKPKPKTKTKPKTKQDELRALRTRLWRDRELFLVALDGSRLVGTLIAGWDGWRGSMARLAVDPSYRRRRIAQRLVSATEARLRQLGARRIGALVFTDNTLGEQFWLAAGYHPESNLKRFVKNLSDSSSSRHRP